MVVVAACQGHTTNVQLSHHTYWHGLQAGIQQINLSIGDRTANRNLYILTFTLTWPEGHVNGRFSWTIEIMQLDFFGHRVKETCLQRCGERFSTAYHLT